MKIVGSYVSPYVRKVLACLHLAGLGYEIDPITPFFGNEAFERLSPLRRIPVLIEGDLVLSDSSVICAWLEEAHGAPLMPKGPADRARARWLEEYADTRLGDLFIWGLFYQRFVCPAVFGRPGDEARVERTLAEDLPREMAYLEGQLPEAGFLFGDSIGLADIAVATFFRNAAYAGVEPDPARWPRTAAFVRRALAQPCFEATLRFERAQLSVDPKGRRRALLDAGAPLTADSLGTREPRPGIMRL
ncbi:MAG: glutathione S-transferase family protein [Alphaproteobacteria bacterium]|nr:glutathione S-transferase family protein [Alphaproteobacteria bacterium]MBV9372913.1 glutathione S-transferase family protein [Alphaproteobacteria bacterium]MBV9899695.1 glutathione S-transferase family protein [Alphaproteobacteria bacterium]